MDSELVDKLDEAWKRQGLHSRMDLFRKSLQAFLQNAGESDVAASVTAGDFRGLRKLRGAAGAKFAAGVLPCDGETSASFGDRLYAVPIRALWETV
jgi:uncharacterized protein YbjT (DUF2867 family)